MTDYLKKEGFWGSFNVPFFQKIRDNMGYTEII